MKDQLKTQAKQLLNRRKGPLSQDHTQAQRVKVPHMGAYKNVHPEVLDHVHQYLEKFKRGLNNGR